MGIFGIDNKRRYLSTGDVKRACGNPAPNTWSRYRSVLNITQNTLTQREAFLLFVLAQLCRYSHNVDPVAVYAAAVKLLEREPQSLNATLKLCGADGVLGRDLAQAIGDATGYYPSERTLYDWGKLPTLPRFDRRMRYSARQVTRFCNHARKMRDRRDSPESTA